MQAVRSCISLRFFSKTNESNVETESVRRIDCKVTKTRNDCQLTKTRNDCQITKTRNDCQITKTRNECQITKTRLIHVKPYSPTAGSHKREDITNN